VPGLQASFKQHLLHAGSLLLYRMLGGKDIDDLQLGGAVLEGLAGDERFAERK
jgi:hypothetical protein